MKLKYLLVLVFVQFGFAQKRTCGMQQQMQIIMNDPVKRAIYLEKQNNFQTQLARMVTISNRNPNVIIKIPVAVHFPSVSNNSSIKACFRTLAQSQINILNADYNALNADIVNYQNDASFYPETNTGSLQIEFVIATQNHPASTGLVNGDLAVTFGTDFLGSNNNDATWTGYLNLVCRNAGNGILGYSNLGASPAAGDCVVIARAAFGSGNGCTGYVPGSPYDLGRTLTHELGHYFNLDHTFVACGEKDCSVYVPFPGNTNGDGVCDTPPQDVEDYNCPAAGDVIGCNGDFALTMNYMDYVNDACMYMFTAGQATRMQAWYDTIASEFRTNTLGNQEFLETSFTIYPNPNRGSFNIKFKDVFGNYSVEVFDVTGKTIYENNFDQSSNLVHTINLEKPSSGVYFMNVKSDKGLVTKKLIVQ